MSKRVKCFVEKMTLKYAIVFSVLFFTAFMLINHSNLGISGLLKLTGGHNILDFEFGFDYQKAYGMLFNLGEEGRLFYLNNIIPMDFPFPLTYMLFYSSWMVVLMKKTNMNSSFLALVFVPVLAMICDWIENIGVIILLKNFPNMPLLAVRMSSISGMIKMCGIIGSIAILLMLSIISIKNKIQNHIKEVHI